MVSLFPFVPPKTMLASFHSFPSFPSSFIIQTLKPPKPSYPTFSPKTRILPCKCQTSPSPEPKSRATMNGQKPTSKNRRKPSHGTSRRSSLKKTFKQEQVMFTTPVSDDPHVAIIGGGMSGLICALNLEKRGVRSTVFDSGMHGLGGRMGTRIIDPHPLVFDHAAQFFTVSDSWFAELVDCWLEKGLVQEWQGVIGELGVGGRFVPLPSSPPRYVGVNGMRPLADSLLSETGMVNVVRPCWISKLEPFNGMWHLSENGKPRGEFDAIVIAHNGKCANRLLASSGLPLVAKQMKRLELSSIWALLAAFEDPLPIPGSTSFEGAFVKGIDSVSWMANNTKKLLRSQSSGPHCWTFFSTAAYGKQNKVPQESIPTVTAEKVKAGMLEGVEAALGLPKGSLKKPFYTRVQLCSVLSCFTKLKQRHGKHIVDHLPNEYGEDGICQFCQRWRQVFVEAVHPRFLTSGWDVMHRGAALPTNKPGIPCIFDPHGRAGICGDWLLGSSLESAALSGMTLANHIADYFQTGGDHPEEFAVGLQNEFQPLEGHDIGQFPGLESEKEINEAQAYQLAS